MQSYFQGLFSGRQRTFPITKLKFVHRFIGLPCKSKRPGSETPGLARRYPLKPGIFPIPPGRNKSSQARPLRRTLRCTASAIPESRAGP